LPTKCIHADCCQNHLCTVARDPNLSPRRVFGTTTPISTLKKTRVIELSIPHSGTSTNWNRSPSCLLQKATTSACQEDSYWWQMSEALQGMALWTSTCSITHAQNNHIWHELDTNNIFHEYVYWNFSVDIALSCWIMFYCTHNRCGFCTTVMWHNSLHCWRMFYCPHNRCGFCMMVLWHILAWLYGSG